MLCVCCNLCYLWALVCVMCGLQSVLCAVCSHEPRRFAPSMPRFARVARFARCGRFAPAGPASKLPCCDCRFGALTLETRSYMYKDVFTPLAPPPTLQSCIGAGPKSERSEPRERSEACSERSDEARDCKLHISQTKDCT